MKLFIRNKLVTLLIAMALLQGAHLEIANAQAYSSSILGTTGSSPEGITIDPAGNIYTANTNSNNVSKITPAGVTTILGTTGTGPIAITIDSVGNIYTANTGSNNVSKITPAGVSTILGSTGANTIAITIDSTGNIYTSNSNANNVSKFSAVVDNSLALAAAAAAERKAKEQRELLEILFLIPKIGGLTLSLGEVTKSLYSNKCVKGKTVKYVNNGSKCPKGYVKK